MLCLLLLDRIYLHTKFYLEKVFGKENRKEKKEKAYLVAFGRGPTPLAFPRPSSPRPALPRGPACAPQLAPPPPPHSGPRRGPARRAERPSSRLAGAPLPSRPSFYDAWGLWNSAHLLPLS